MIKKLHTLLIVFSIISHFCFAQDAEKAFNDYNIAHKEPIEGLPLKESWYAKVPITKYNKIWTTWNSIILQSPQEDHSIYSIKKESGILRWITPMGFELENTPPENVNGLYVLYKNMIYIIDPLHGGLTKKTVPSYAVAGNLAAGQFSVYAWEWGKKLHMMNTNNASVGWSTKLEEEMNQIATPHIRLDYAYIPTPAGIFYCYDAQGNKVWEFKNISIYEDLQYYGKAIDATATKIAKERQQASPDLKKIKYFKDQIHAFNDKIDTTENRTRGKYLGSPAFYGDNVYIGSTDGSVYSLNRFSGHPEWEYRLGEHVIGNLVALKDMVIVFSETKGAVSIKGDKTSAQLNWILPGAHTLVNATEKYLYFLVNKNELICIDRKYAIKKWSYEVPSNLEVIPDLESDALMIIDKNAKDSHLYLYALTEVGNIPKVDDYELLEDVGYHHYNTIAIAAQEREKQELEKANKAQQGEGENANQE